MTKTIRQISLTAIQPDPTQPRKDFDAEELQELAQSIRQNGLLSPITVKGNGDGVYTWVSMEPVLYPDQSLELIRISAPFVDEYKIGILNYHPHAKTINWREYGLKAAELINSLGKKIYIKEDLRRYLRQPTRVG